MMPGNECLAYDKETGSRRNVQPGDIVKDDDGMLFAVECSPEGRYIARELGVQVPFIDYVWRWAHYKIVGNINTFQIN
jgi:hypothetical protein